MSSTPWYPSDLVKAQIVEQTEAINVRVETFGFCVWPLYPESENGIPAGFTTIGFTRLELPEIYVSGIAPHSECANGIIDNLKTLYISCKEAGYQLTSSELCRQINITDTANASDYQWRPIDPIRLMYGQGTALRYWAESVGLVDTVQGVQIVHRTDNGQFPMESTPAQLLLDWIPFGTDSYKLPAKALNNGTSI